MRWLGGLLAISLAAVALCGCGGGGSTTAETGSEPQPVSQRLQAIVRETPYLPWFRKCMEGEISRRLAGAKPAELKKLDGLSDAEFEKQAGEVLFAVAESCTQPDRKFVDPNASEEELKLLRSSQEAGVGLLLRSRGVSTRISECVEKGIDALPAGELLDLMQGAMSSRQSKFSELGKRCQ